MEARISLWAASQRQLGRTTLDDATLVRVVGAWLADRAEHGWDYSQAVYAAYHFGVDWPRDGERPASVSRAMRSWYEASRWRGGGLAPEDVASEIIHRGSYLLGMRRDAYERDSARL